MDQVGEEKIYWWVTNGRFEKVLSSDLLETLELLTELYFKHRKERMAAKKLMSVQR